MLKLLPQAVAALALAFAPAAFAQTTQVPVPTTTPAEVPASPALWVVKDKDTTIYLFGTIHVLKPGLRWFDKGVKTAFDQSDQLVLELLEPDQATMQGLILKLAFKPEGPTVTEQLPEDKRAPYAAALTGVGVPPQALDKFAPWFPAVTLSVATLPKYGYDPASGAERVLTGAAKDAGKPIEGLETAEQQLGYFAGLPQATQIKFLTMTIDQLPKLASTLDQMVAEWAKGDPDALARLLNEDMDETPEIAKVLLSERNQRWAQWIEKRLETPGTVFIAVGAGHLAGPESVQAYLAKDKVKAARVQ
ncbi:TraB/GumN family protein [Sphingomonas sp.]|uniref:TraB/GumN family protein n=1 Tax=Sphingomonas sp. TaxID=28214 RepID=UPI001B246AE3|nr:TraB/GumN family protein [Sphingomonas sp.]MBO9712299.1 TraB/GumN family protein [Sphingomonas sp.]